MKVIGHRFVHVASREDAKGFNAMLQNLGISPIDLEAKLGESASAFEGNVYEAGSDISLIQIWAEGEGMPAGTMLQIIVDDADAFAAHARSNSLEPQGPFEMHGERVYMLSAPDGLPVSFQSAVSD